MSHIFVTQEDAEEAADIYGVPPYGPLGYITDQRTYRRWLPDLRRRETFYERNGRVVNYNVGLAVGRIPMEDLEDEAEQLFFLMNHMLGFPSGRSLWVGGTETAAAHPAATYNCSFLAINRLSAFLTLCELLMLGCGVGFRVFDKDIDQLPSISTKELNFSFAPYQAKEASKREEHTNVVLDDDGLLVVTVGDSREGWVDAIRTLLEAWFNQFPFSEGGLVGDPIRVEFNFDNIRPKGTRIAGFGGTASGPEALQGILENIIDIFRECPGERLRSIDCMDICDCIARGIIAGSSRRSALICLFQEGDALCANSKVDLFNPDRKDLVKKHYRIQSNNTECIGSSPTSLKLFREFLEKNPDCTLEVYKKEAARYRPSKEWFRERFKVVSVAGDPGFNNYLHMIARKWLSVREHRPNVPVDQIWDRYCDIGTNPCHEIILSAGYSDEPGKSGYGVGYCNLVTLPLQKFVNYWTDGFTGEEVPFLDKDLLEEAVRAITRVSLRQTCVDMPRPELDDTQKEERLLGVSATGWRQLFDILGWDTYKDQIAIQNLQVQMNAWANLEATSYAKELGVERPLLVTCIKPEGTGSKVFGSSDGLHWEWAPYYIRRVEMSSSDALAKTLRDQGFVWHPTPYDLSRNFPEGSVWEAIEKFDNLSVRDKEPYWEQSHAVIFDFPMKSKAKVSQGQVSALEQLDNAMGFATHYTDHMPSSTITVKEDEWDVVTDYVYENWENYLTAAFLSYWSGNHPLLPYEDISKQTYEELTEHMISPYIVRDRNGDIKTYLVNEDLMTKYERADLDDGVDIDEVELSSGACPVR